MKTTHRILGITLATLLSAAGGFAQSPTTTPPTGTPAGSSSTGTINSGGVAPATGRPSDTPTGPTAGGTGSGTTAPVTGTITTTLPPTTMPPTTLPPVGLPVTPSVTTTPPTTTPTGPGNSNPHTPNEHASDTAKAVQAVLLQFEAQRDLAIAARKTLIDNLQAARTDAERQAIIAQLRTETQAEKDEQSALGKQIRDELKTLRNQRKSGGG